LSPGSLTLSLSNERYGVHMARSFRLSPLGLVYAGLLALVCFAAPITAAVADDGMRLCAVRWSKCTCRAAGDLPGTWTFLPDSRCQNGTSASTPPPVEAASNKALPPSTSPAVAAAPNVAGPVVAAPSAAAPGILAGILAPVTNAFSSSAAPTAAPASGKMRLCAMRRGTCSCQAVGDGPGQWTEFEASRCATESAAPTEPVSIPASKSATTVAVAAAPPLVKPKPAVLQSPKQSTAAASTGFSDCAIRNGLCTCKGPTDNDGQWSLVDGSRCKVILLSNLSSAPSSPLPVTKETTQDVQRLLVRLGYDPGPASGQFDKRTEAAIKSFQEGSGMPVDGKMTDLLVSRLRSLQPDNSAINAGANAAVTGKIAR
jgi:Putative peptidoglycan binding domain